MPAPLETGHISIEEERGEAWPARFIDSTDFFSDDAYPQVRNRLAHRMVAYTDIHTRLLLLDIHHLVWKMAKWPPLWTEAPLPSTLAPRRRRAGHSLPICVAPLANTDTLWPLPPMDGVAPTSPRLYSTCLLISGLWCSKASLWTLRPTPPVANSVKTQAAFRQLQQRGRHDSRRKRVECLLMLGIQMEYSIEASDRPRKARP